MRERERESLLPEHSVPRVLEQRGKGGSKHFPGISTTVSFWVFSSDIFQLIDSLVICI